MKKKYKVLEGIICFKILFVRIFSQIKICISSYTTQSTTVVGTIGNYLGLIKYSINGR